MAIGGSQSTLVLGGAREAAEAFAGHPLRTDVDVELPGRLEKRPGEVRDGAHNPDGVRWLTCGQVVLPVKDPLLVGVWASLGRVVHFDYVQMLGKG